MRYVLESVDPEGTRTIEPSLPYAVALAEFCRRCDIEDAGTSEGDETRGLLYDGTALTMRPATLAEIVDPLLDESNKIWLDSYAVTLHPVKFMTALRRAMHEHKSEDYESEEFATIYGRHLHEIVAESFVQDLVDIGELETIGIGEDGELLYALADIDAP